MDKFNEELAAKDAIANSPEVTESALETHETSEKALISEPQALISEPNAWDKRNARLLTKGLRNFGGKLDDDQLSAIEDLSAEGFGILSALNAPKAVNIFITLLLVAIPFFPVALGIREAFQDNKEEGISYE